MKFRYRILPDVFTMADLRERFGVTTRNAEKIIERWQNEGYIKNIDYGLYQKLFLELT